MVDALSWKHEEEPVLAMISFPSPMWIEELKLNYDQSLEIKLIITALHNGEVALGGYLVQQGLLLKMGKVVLVPSSLFQRKILHHILASPKAGHVGYHQTLQKTKLDFSWLGMRKNIKKLVKSPKSIKYLKVPIIRLLGCCNLYQYHSYHIEILL